MALAHDIFISATSSDLHSARDVVAKVLTSIGYTPVWQDIAATDAGNLTEVLRARLKPCAAVIQLVGLRYGAEPRQPDAEFGRCSYTQMEALYAEKDAKKVIYIFLPENFPTDPCEPEAEEKTGLQLAYRRRLKEQGVLRHNVSSLLELENRILRVRDDLAIIRAEMEKSRRRLLGIGALAILLLAATGFGVWRLTGSAHEQQKTLTVLARTGEGETKSLAALQQSAATQDKTDSRIEAKVDEIRALPEGARADRLNSALAAANAEELFALRAAGVTPLEVQAALGRKFGDSDKSLARQFFDNSRDSPRAIEWLKAVLKDGLDPNFTISDPYFERKAFFLHAVAAGNGAASIALLEAGASPHPYEGIWLTTTYLPWFLFPYGALMDDETFSAGEKTSLAKAMRDAGAVITRYDPGSAETKTRPDGLSGLSEQRVDVEKVFSHSKEIFGFQIEETPSLSQQPVSKIAEAAGKRGEPWVEYIKVMPLRLISQERPDFGPFWIEIRNLIGIYGERGYFLGVGLDYGDGCQYALIEVSKDFRSWNVYLHIGTRAGMGFAKDKSGQQEYGNNMPAWRKFSFRRVSDTEMSLSDFYKYRTTRDVTENVPRY